MNLVVTLDILEMEVEQLEHSHALHLALVLLNELGISKYKTKFYKQYIDNNHKLYDNLALVFLVQKLNLKLDIDLITFPAEKISLLNLIKMFGYIILRKIMML